MNKSQPYECKAIVMEKGIKFIFISKGKMDVIKIIEYYFVKAIGGLKIYNLGFGDYQLNTDKINDNVLTGNGDTYHVFNTVLNTIPLFFNKFPSAAVIVQGSDSSTEFYYNRRHTCSKKCEITCKNQHRRINAYNSFVNKNYEELVKEYQFFGVKRQKAV